MSSKLLRTICALLVIGGANACLPRETTGPTNITGEDTATPNPVRNDLVPSDATDTVVALTRSAYLPMDVSASATIGPEGGIITVGAAGGRIIFPAGALRQATHIKMTAKSGWNVAYEFCPHGIVFDVPVVIEQDLTNTSATGMKDARMLQAGYFAKGLDAIFVDRGRSLARVSELRGVQVDLPTSPRLARFFIYHFSGYIMSSGFAPTGGDSTFTQQ